MKKSINLICGCLIWTLCSGRAMGEAWTGKIVIDGAQYGSESSSVIIGNGRPATQRRTLACFDRIAVDATVDIVYRPGKTCELSLSADSNLVNAIESEVRSRILTITTKRSFRTASPVRAEIISPTLENLKIRSSSDAELMSMDAASFSLDLSGSGDIRADGTVGLLAVTTAGSSTLELQKLKAEKADIRISGVADASIFASDALYVEIQGVGDVLYYGHPKSVKKRISGVGTVQAAD